jgi:hypothetical protein
VVTMELFTTLLIYLAGTVFVVMFAVRFFNDKSNDKLYEPRDADVKDALAKDPRLDPALPKYLTEKSRYNMFLGVFVSFTVLLYYFISLIFPTLITNGLGNDIETSYHVALVLGTLAFINLSPKIPHLKDTLKDWRDDLHKRAEIPDRALKVFDILRFYEINKSSAEFKANCDEIFPERVAGYERCDIEPSYFSYRKDKIERKWARLVYLMHAIDQWGKSQQFRRHLESTSLKWLALYAYYRDRLIPKMERYGDWKLDKDKVEETTREIDIISIKIYWLVTLLLFMASRVAEDPRVHLKRIGWIVFPENYFKFSSRQIIFTGSAVFLSIVVGAGLGSVILMSLDKIDSSSFSISPGMILNWLIYGIPMFVVPLAVTLFLKRYLSMHNSWPVKRPEDPRESFVMRPWNVYFSVSLSSYFATVTALVGIMFVVSLVRPIETSQPYAQIMLYSGLAFITSTFICYLIDTPSPGWETSWRYYLKNIVPSLLQGGINVLMIMFAFLLFNGHQRFGLSLLDRKEMGDLIIYAVIGFIIGIAMFLTSRIGTKFYERRTGDAQRSTDGWWTISIESARKRVRANSSDGNYLEVVADEELKELAEVGDTIGFYNKTGLVMMGNVDEIDEESIRIVIPV